MRIIIGNNIKNDLVEQAEKHHDRPIVPESMQPEEPEHG